MPFMKLVVAVFSGVSDKSNETDSIGICQENCGSL